MNLPVNFNFIPVPIWVLIIPGSLIASGITWATVPLIIKISGKGISYIPKGRTSHITTNTAIAGLVLLIGLIVSTFRHGSCIRIPDCTRQISFKTRITMGLIK